MLDIEFSKSLKSKLSLVFKDEELESSFMNERENRSFHAGVRMYTILLIGFTIVLLFTLITGEYRTKETINEEKFSCQIKFEGRKWMLYIFPLLIIGFIIELLISKAPKCFRKKRGMLLILLLYILFVGSIYIYIYNYTCACTMKYRTLYSNVFLLSSNFGI